MIKANFKTYNDYVTDSVYQWDLNHVLSVRGLNLSVAPEIHFSNANMDKAIVRQSTLTSGVVSAQIPNSLLQDPLTIRAHIGIYEGDTFKIVESVSIPVIPKERPADYRIEDSDEEIYSFQALKNAIANMVKSADFAIEKTAIIARIDNIIAHNNDTEGNTELVDMRRGADGKMYDTAGSAIRTQIGNVSNDLRRESLNLGALNFKYDVNEHFGYLTPTGTVYNIDLYHCLVTNKIQCEPGYVFGYKGNGSGTATSYVFYSGNSVVDSGDIASKLTFTDVIIPDGVDGVVFASYDKIEKDIIFDLKLINPSNIITSSAKDMIDARVSIELGTIKYAESFGYLLDTGEFATATTYHCLYTPKIYCNEGEIFQYKGRGANAAQSYIFYNDDNIIGSGTVLSHDKYTDIIIPSGVNYVVFSSYDVINTPLILDIIRSNPTTIRDDVDYLKKSNILYGKKFVACGDSFTQWSDETYDSGIYAGEYVTFDREIRLRNNMTGYNDGISGSILAISKEYLEGSESSINYRSPFIYERYLDIPEDTDYCTIAFGINDETHTNLGTIDDTTNETFYGALNILLEWLLRNRPGMKTLFIIWSRVGNGSPGDTGYRKAIIDTCRKWGYPYFDPYNDDKIPPYLYGKNPEFGLCDTAKELRKEYFHGVDNTSHPGAIGHKYESTIIENILRGL